MKQFFLITFLTLVVGAITSPALAGGKIEVGPLFALNSSKFFGQDTDRILDNQQALNTSTGGVFVRYYLSEKFSLAPELTYAKRGARFSVTGTSGDTVSTYTLVLHMSYIDIPVLMRFKPHIHANLNPYIIAGPSIAFALSGESEWRLAESTPEGEIITEDHTLERVDIYNVANIQVGLVAGIGLDFQKGRYGFSVEGRYSGHLSNAFSDLSGYDESPEGQESFINPDGSALQLKNGALSLQFYLSYALGI